ncbi:hypothetical protein, partial [Metabacillus niabensis]|uniref:hypothetical protein n=1 Tax=Metabacillus niabensis TaxID=324854 RepID=UPI0039A0E65F
MKVLKKAVMYLLVGVLAISLSNGGIVVKADSIEKSPEGSLPLKVRVFIMQLIGWIEFGIQPDL